MKFHKNYVSLLIFTQFHKNHKVGPFWPLPGFKTSRKVAKVHFYVIFMIFASTFHFYEKSTFYHKKSTFRPDRKISTKPIGILRFLGVKIIKINHFQYFAEFQEFSIFSIKIKIFKNLMIFTKMAIDKQNFARGPPQNVVRRHDSQPWAQNHQ